MTPSKLEDMLATFGQELIDSGWQPALELPLIFDEDEPDGNHRLIFAARLFLKRYLSQIKSAICLDGKPKQEIASSVQLIAAVASAMKFIPDMPENAETAASIIVMMGLDRVCSTASS